MLNKNSGEQRKQLTPESVESILQDSMMSDIKENARQSLVEALEYLKGACPNRFDAAASIAAKLYKFYEEDIENYKRLRSEVAERFKVSFPFLEEVQPKLVVALTQRLLELPTPTLEAVATAGMRIDRPLAQKLQSAAIELPNDCYCKTLSVKQLSLYLQLLTRRPDTFSQTFTFVAIRYYYSQQKEGCQNSERYAIVNFIEETDKLPEELFSQIIIDTASNCGISIYQYVPDELASNKIIQNLKLGELESESLIGTTEIFQKSVATQIRKVLENVQIAIKGNFPEDLCARLLYDIRRIRHLLTNVLPASDGYSQASVN